MKYFLVFLSACIPLSAWGTIDHSVTPLMEKYESLEALNPKKYTKKQFQQIKAALEKKEEKFRVMSFNVLLPFHDHNLEAVNRWPARLPRIIDLIDEMAPDVIGVQELYGDQERDLMPSLQQDFAFCALPCEDGEKNGIFYRKSRFELVDCKVWPMFASETLTMVKLKDLKTAKVIAVFNAHFAFSNIEKREQQAEFVAKTVGFYEKVFPVIFMGDLNTFSQRLELDLPAYDGDHIHRILTRGNLRDGREKALLGHLGPLSSFTNEASDKKPFCGTGTPGVILDHIYVTPQLTVLIHAIQPAKVDGHFPSDHMPVVVDIL